MKKYLAFIVLAMGIITNILLLSGLYLFESQTTLGLLLGSLGAIFSIINFKKMDTQINKICMLISGVINAFPVLYFIFLFITLG